MRRSCWLLLLPVLMTVAGMLLGAGWLVRPTPGWPALPLGNAATSVSLLCLAALSLCRPLRGWRRALAAAGMVLALAWAPVSRLVTGNWAFVDSVAKLPVSWGLLSGALTTLVLLAALAGALTAPRERRA